MTTAKPEILRVYGRGERPASLPGRGGSGISDEVMAQVTAILAEVRDGGDTALRRLTAEYDGCRLDDFRVTEAEITDAYDQVDEGFLAALRQSIKAVRAFHVPQMRTEVAVETGPGVRAWREWRAIKRVGLYVPGGRARYPSSVVMLGIPAHIAGCAERVLMTPPRPDGHIPAATLVAAAEAGITEIYKVGGAQAIGALAYGTESISPVAKVFGPGNQYVTAAKLQIFPSVAIDLPAGPSELMIIADDSANAAWVAADMLANAEHGPDSPVLLVSPHRILLEEVEIHLAEQLAKLPRAEIARTALSNAGCGFLVDDMEQAAALANEFCPEHLQLMVREPQALLSRIENAGSVFLGPDSPNAAGDYATGTNHVLPTGGFARMFGPLSVEAFGRHMEVQELTESGIRRLAPIVGPLARAEGLEGHARAVEIRGQGIVETV